MRLRSLGTLGSIRTVPFTATVFCNVVDFALVQHAIISRLEAHAQCRTTRHRTFACLREVKAFTHRHVATMLLCSEKMLGLRSFLARSSCDQQGCTPQQCRFLWKTVVTFAICIGGTARQMDHGRHVPRLRPFVSEWARFAPPLYTRAVEAVFRHVGSLERLACARELLR